MAAGFSKEDVDYYVGEIREHPEHPWSSTNRQLAESVYKEVSKQCATAKLYHGHFNHWITQNAEQERELLEMLERITERREEELESLRETMEEIKKCLKT